MRLTAPLPSGLELRMTAGREPLEDGGKPFLHVSVSVGVPGITGSVRPPRDDEIEAVRECWTEQLIEEGSSGNTRHFWEAGASHAPHA
jgi:hypothetical protein